MLLATFICCFIASLPAQAEFNLTTGLNEASRQQLVRILGLGVNNKNTSIPGALGTDHGLEVSIANEFISTEKVSQLIQDKGSRNTLFYPKISIGKGLYDRVDLFIHFIPYTATLGLSEFGGAVRLHITRSESSPLVTSAVLGFNSATFNNQLNTQGVSLDFSMGMQWDYLSVFSSVGLAQAKGRFVGGTQGVTDTLTEQSERVSSFHFSVGALGRYNIYFMSLALDHYYQPVYTGKVGFYF